MITYLCPKCNIDSAMCERDKPRCFYCENTEELTIIKKEPMLLQSSRLKPNQFGRAQPELEKFQAISLRWVQTESPNFGRQERTETAKESLMCKL